MASEPVYQGDHAARVLIWLYKRCESDLNCILNVLVDPWNMNRFCSLRERDWMKAV
jgi:hypothetical protein